MRGVDSIDAPRRPEAPAPPRDAGADSLFGSTQFDAPAAPAPARAAPRLELCHVGVVLRALLFVQGSLAIGAAVVADNFAAWLGDFASASAVAVPGLLAWLCGACLAERWLARRSAAVQGVALVALGAASGVVGRGFGALAGLDAQAADYLAAALAGAWFALLLALWLRLRQRTRQPADTAARLAELQARIRPHFLFNTLNSVLGLIGHDAARAEVLLEDLAELFRVALAERGESASLDDEIDLARRYLAIEQIRFGDRLKVVWELDPAAGSARLPPLLLQPLVENAVQHGVEPDPQGGVIRVRTRAQRGSALVSIANTLPAAASRAGHGIALDNVRERLALLHDVAAQFQLRETADAFRVQIRVPL